MSSIDFGTKCLQNNAFSTGMKNLYDFNAEFKIYKVEYLNRMLF